MNFKICKKCGELKKLSEFNWRNERRGWRHGFCKQCHSIYRHNHYILNRRKYLLKAKKWNGNQTLVLRKFIWSYLKNNPCVDCGKKDIRVLDFDHVKAKRMNISLMLRNCHSVNSLVNEIKKFKVRCANCHRVKTFARGNYWKHKMGL